MDQMIKAIRKIIPITSLSAYQNSPSKPSQTQTSTVGIKICQKQKCFGKSGYKRPLRNLSLQRDRKKMQKKQQQQKKDESKSHRSNYSQLMESINLLEQHYDKLQCRRSLFTQRSCKSINKNNGEQTLKKSYLQQNGINTSGGIMASKYVPKSRINLVISDSTKNRALDFRRTQGLIRADSISDFNEQQSCKISHSNSKQFNKTHSKSRKRLTLTSNCKKNYRDQVLIEEQIDNKVYKLNNHDHRKKGIKVVSKYGANKGEEKRNKAIRVKDLMEINKRANSHRDRIG